METQWIVRNIILILSFAMIGFLFLKKSQSSKLNWAMFYACLWVTISLPIINLLSENLNFWHFSDNESMLKMPFDLYFVWIVFWGILPVYFLKGKYVILITLILFWIDLLFMPQLDKIGIVTLNNNWLYGEILLLLFVFLPAYLWGKFSYEKSNLSIRASFQVITMGLIFAMILPHILIAYTTNDIPKYDFNSYLFQVILIIVFPSLVAVQNLVNRGNGTPFPYDKTEKLVQSGVYAYCKNPIQWSFTLLFIPLSIYYNSYLLLLGSLISIAYTFGVSNYQENNDMKLRFGKEWENYSKKTPSWRFLWKPKNISNGTIYFKKDCTQCEEIKKWFENKKPRNLSIKYSLSYKESTLLQVTYVDIYGLEHKSIKAISRGLEHTNLAYACIGWFMNFPIINHILQTIIDSMDFNNVKECELPK